MNPNCKIHGTMMLLDEKRENLYCIECEIEKGPKCKSLSSVVIPDTTREEINKMALTVKHKTRQKSAIKTRHEVSKILLSTVRIKHKSECIKCLINCEVKHAEDTTFWARKEGLDPVYSLETCPKVSNDKVKEAKKSQRKRR